MEGALIYTFSSRRSYRKTNQVSSVKKLLNTDNKLQDGTKIIDKTKKGTNFFAKGHLSPDAAFIGKDIRF